MVAQGEHPYYTAYTDAAKLMAKTYGIDLKVTIPNWDLNTQNQYIDQAINEKPDLIILLPLDANAALQQFKKINGAGIPVIAAHICRRSGPEVLPGCGQDRTSGLPGANWQSSLPRSSATRVDTRSCRTILVGRPTSPAHTVT